MASSAPAALEPLGPSPPISHMSASSPPPSPLSPSPPSHTVMSHPALYLLSGAVAGLSVDVVLFPLDTVKTRMQSAEGFMASGGFKNIYAGIGSAAIGSAPSAAMFFAAYELTKHTVPRLISGVDVNSPLVHCSAAAIGEIFACLIRVPTDNIKQKLQAGLFTRTGDAVRHIVASGGVGGFYAGYLSTIMREIPFSLIQFPLYEAMKRQWRERNQREASNLQLALMGSVTGAVAAALTTPMDVVKTRLMLLKGEAKPPSILTVMRQVYSEGGMVRLFAGIGPRVMWIGLGGAVFLGGYEATKRSLMQTRWFADEDRVRLQVS